MSPTTSTIISVMTVRIIFLRVSARSARAVPSLRQIPAQHHETISIRDGKRLHLFGAELVELGFEMAHHN